MNEFFAPLQNETFSLRREESDVSLSRLTSIIRMIALNIGANQMQSSIRNYIKANAKQAVDKQQFYDQLPPLQSISCDQIINSWLKVNNVVYIHAHRHHGSNPGVRLIRPKKFSQFIPITFSTSNKLNFEQTQATFWMQPKIHDHFLELNETLNENDWILINNQASGHYRVLYDEKNWKLLIDQMKNRNLSTIHVINRAQLIDDAMHFAQSQMLAFDVALNLISYLKNESEYLPWATIERHIDFLDQMLRSSYHYYVFKEFVRNLLTDLYSKLRLTDKCLIDDIKRMQRIIVARLACKYEVDDCIFDVEKISKKIVSRETIFS